MKLVRYISFVFVLCFLGNAKAQDYVMEAYNLYQAESFDEAAVKIDSALLTDAAQESQTWQLRGLIYKGKDETNMENIDVALESFVKAKSLDEAQTDKINNFIKNTLFAYYNKSVVLMDALELESSEEHYKIYKSKYKELLNAEMDFSGSDVQFYLALGDAYSRKVKSHGGEEKIELSKRAAEAYKIVLNLDSTNYDANIGAGISYYNLGADIISNMSLTETPIEEIQIGIEKSIEYFNLALPYLKKAHQQNPENKTIIEGLAGTYLGLQDDEQFNVFNNKLKELEERDD